METIKNLKWLEYEIKRAKHNKQVKLLLFWNLAKFNGRILRKYKLKEK